jgi:hypothetical protein
MPYLKSNRLFISVYVCTNLIHKSHCFLMSIDDLVLGDNPATSANILAVFISNSDGNMPAGKITAIDLSVSAIKLVRAADLAVKTVVRCNRIAVCLQSNRGTATWLQDGGLCTMNTRPARYTTPHTQHPPTPLNSRLLTLTTPDRSFSDV